MQFRGQNFRFITMPMQKVHATIVKCRHGCCSSRQSLRVRECVAYSSQPRHRGSFLSGKTVVNQLTKVAHFSRLHPVKYLSRHRRILRACTLARLTRSLPSNANCASRVSSRWKLESADEDGSSFREDTF